MKNKPAAFNIEKIKAYLREKEKIRQQKQQQEFDQTAKKLKALTHYGVNIKLNEYIFTGPSLAVRFTGNRILTLHWKVILITGNC